MRMISMGSLGLITCMATAAIGCTRTSDNMDQATEPERGPEEKDPRGTAMSKSEDDAASVGPDRIRIELERKRAQPNVALELTLPKGWRTSQSYGPNTLEPIEQPDSRMFTSVGLRVTPVDKAAASVAAQIQAARQSHVQYAERPNINTGKPELDAVRAEVQVIEDEEFPGGWSQILRVRYAHELVTKGPYKPYISVRCYHYDEARDYIVELSGRLPLAAERSTLSEIQSICRSVKVLEPA